MPSKVLTVWRSVLRFLRLAFVFALVFIPVPIANLFNVMVKRARRTESGEVVRREDQS